MKKVADAQSPPRPFLITSSLDVYPTFIKPTLFFRERENFETTEKRNWL